MTQIKNPNNANKKLRKKYTYFQRVVSMYWQKTSENLVARIWIMFQKLKMCIFCAIPICKFVRTT